MSVPNGKFLEQGNANVLINYTRFCPVCVICLWFPLNDPCVGSFIDTGTREQSLTFNLIGSKLVCESCAVEEFFFICNHPSNVSVVRGDAMHLSTCCGPSCQGSWYCLEFLSRRSNDPFRSLWENSALTMTKGT